MNERSRIPEKELSFRILLVSFLLYGLFSSIYNILHFHDTPCGMIIRRGIIITSTSSLVFIIMYATLRYFAVEPDFTKVENMQCDSFYVTSVFMILFGLITLVTCIWGEINFIRFAFKHRISDCIGIVDILICITVYGLLNIFVLYWGYVSLFNCYYIVYTDKFLDYEQSNKEINEEDTYTNRENEWNMQDDEEVHLNRERMSSIW